MQRKTKKEPNDCNCHYTGFHPMFGVIGKKKKAAADKPAAQTSGGTVTRTRAKASTTENPKPTLKPKAKPTVKPKSSSVARSKTKSTTKSASR